MDILEQRVGLAPGHNVQGVPADVGHLECRVAQVIRQRADRAGDKPKAAVCAVLIAFFKQELHAQTDAEQRLFLRFFAQNRYKSGGLQLGHCISKGPDTGQQDMICRPQIRRIAGHADLRAQTFDAG